MESAEHTAGATRRHAPPAHSSCRGRPKIPRKSPENPTKVPPQHHSADLCPLRHLFHGVLHCPPTLTPCHLGGTHTVLLWAPGAVPGAGQTRALRHHLVPARAAPPPAEAPARSALLLPALAHAGAVPGSAWVTVEPRCPHIVLARCSGQPEPLLRLVSGPQRCQERSSPGLRLGAPLAPGIQNTGWEDLAVISHGSRQMEQRGSSCEGICREQKHALCRGPGKRAAIAGNALEQPCPPRPEKPLK